MQIIPPTPTPMPVGTPIPLNLENDLLWDMAPQAVGLWNQFGQYTPVVQWVIVAILLGLLIWMISIMLKKTSEEEA